MKFFSANLDKIKDPFKVNMVGIKFLNDDNFTVVAYTSDGKKVQIAEPINCFFRPPEFVIDEFSSVAGSFYMKNFATIPYTSTGSNNFCVNTDNFKGFRFVTYMDKRKVKRTSVEALFDEDLYIVVDDMKSSVFNEKWKEYYKRLELKLTKRQPTSKTKLNTGRQQLGE